MDGPHAGFPGSSVVDFPREHVWRPEDRRRAVTPVDALGPGSWYWRYFGDSRSVILAGSAFLLQISHPVIGAAISTTSTYMEDPWGRAARSLQMLWPVVYNTREGAIEKGRQLREWHRPIKGEDKHGTRFRGLDPEAYAWVHITSFAAILQIAETFDAPLNRRQQEELFREFLVMGRLLGIRDQDMPADIEAYWAYWDWMLTERLQMTDQTRLWLDGNMLHKVRLSPTRFLPEAPMKPVALVGNGVFYISLKGSLPDVFRERFGVRYSKTEQRLYKAMAFAIRQAWKVMPVYARYVPYAWWHVRRAKRYPLEYGPSRW